MAWLFGTIDRSLCSSYIPDGNYLSFLWYLERKNIVHSIIFIFNLIAVIMDDTANL